MASVFFLVLGMLLLSQTLALKDFGPCPDRDVKKGFQLNKFLGLWFEMQRYKLSFEMTLSCVETTVSPLPGAHVSVRNTGTNLAGGATLTGVAYPPDTSVPAKLLWQVGHGLTERQTTPTILLVESAIFEDSLAQRDHPKYMATFPVNYWILDTDYYNYAVIYSCANQGVSHEELTWVLSRDRKGLNSDAQQAVNDVLSKNNFAPSNFMNTTQTRCNN